MRILQSDYVASVVTDEQEPKKKKRNHERTF